MTGTIAVIMVFSIPIVAIVTGHFQKQSKIRYKIVQEEIQLERLKQENYLLETQKMKMELEKMQLESPIDETKWS